MHPIAAAAFKTDCGGEFVFVEVIGLMEGILKVGIAADGLTGLDSLAWMAYST